MFEVFTEMLVTVDFIIWLLVGAVAGWLAGRVMKGGYGMTGNIAIGIIGSVISGFVFDWVNVIDIGDLMDPLIAGLFGAIILLSVAALFRRTESSVS